MDHFVLSYVHIRYVYVNSMNYLVHGIGECVPQGAVIFWKMNFKWSNVAATEVAAAFIGS